MEECEIMEFSKTKTLSINFPAERIPAENISGSQWGKDIDKQ